MATKLTLGDALGEIAKSLISNGGLLATFACPRGPAFSRRNSESARTRAYSGMNGSVIGKVNHFILAVLLSSISRTLEPPM